jgi:hypothetical protein
MFIPVTQVNRRGWFAAGGPGRWPGLYDRAPTGRGNIDRPVVPNHTQAVGRTVTQAVGLGCTIAPLQGAEYLIGP